MWWTAADWIKKVICMVVVVGVLLDEARLNGSWTKFHIFYSKQWSLFPGPDQKRHIRLRILNGKNVNKPLARHIFSNSSHSDAVCYAECSILLVKIILDVFFPAKDSHAAYKMHRGNWTVAGIPPFSTRFVIIWRGGPNGDTHFLSLDRSQLHGHGFR